MSENVSWKHLHFPLTNVVMLDSINTAFPSLSIAQQ